MNKLLKALYDKFYDPLPEVELKREVEECHRALIDVLGKPERKLVLQIIDCKDQIAENLSVDSFICGFQLAWQMANELNTYQEGRPVPTREVGVDVLSASQEGGET